LRSTIGCAGFALQMAFLSLLSLVQSLVVWVGLAAGLVYCVWGSSRGRVSVGDTVLFISMMQQLYVPLTFFGSYYRQVRERMPASGKSHSALQMAGLASTCASRCTVLCINVSYLDPALVLQCSKGRRVLGKLHEALLFPASGDQGID
jgi:ABC-type multidrug transport system fused ATPase/permease subunit